MAHFVLKFNNTNCGCLPHTRMQSSLQQQPPAACQLTSVVSISSALPPQPYRYLTTSRCPFWQADNRHDIPFCISMHASHPTFATPTLYVALKTWVHTYLNTYIHDAKLCLFAHILYLMWTIIIFVHMHVACIRYTYICMYVCTVRTQVRVHLYFVPEMPQVLLHIQVLTASVMLISALHSTSRVAQSTKPIDAAVIRAVVPFIAWALMLHPAATSSLMSNTWPFAADRRRGVSPCTSVSKHSQLLQGDAGSAARLLCKTHQFIYCLQFRNQTFPMTAHFQGKVLGELRGRHHVF